MKKRKLKQRTKRVVKYKRPKNLAFITAFEVSGMQHYPRQFELKVGDRVTLVPVDNNPHDPFAIGIHRLTAMQIGWFPRVEPQAGVYNSRTAGSLQQSLHRMIKQDLSYYAEISAVSHGRPVTVSFYLVQS